MENNVNTEGPHILFKGVKVHLCLLHLPATSRLAFASLPVPPLHSFSCHILFCVQATAIQLLWNSSLLTDPWGPSQLVLIPDCLVCLFFPSHCSSYLSADSVVCNGCESVGQTSMHRYAAICGGQHQVLSIGGQTSLRFQGGHITRS